METFNNVRADKVRDPVQDDGIMPFLLQFGEVKVKHATEQVRGSEMSCIVEIPILSIAMLNKPPSCTLREFSRRDFITIYGRERKPLNDYCVLQEYSLLQEDCPRSCCSRM